MHRATSHTQLRLLLAGAAVACLALPPRRLPAQPPRGLPSQRPLPPPRDGSHDFDFLEGTWQISDAPADYFTRGPFGRLVARIPAPRTATLEWYTREPDTVADSGFVRMSYDSSSNQWMIHEAKKPNGVAPASARRPLRARHRIVHRTSRARRPQGARATHVDLQRPGQRTPRAGVLRGLRYHVAEAARPGAPPREHLAFSTVTLRGNVLCARRGDLVFRAGGKGPAARRSVRA